MESNRRNLVILFLTMMVIMLAFGMVIPILPFYVKSFGASGMALGALMAIYGVMQVNVAGFAVSLVAIMPKETRVVEEIPTIEPDKAG